MKKSKIHEPYNKLKGFFVENNITYSQAGSLLGVTTSTVSQKINGYSDFYLSELKLIKETYKTPEDIFL